MTNRLVHVARNGKIIGQFPPEQLASLMDTGHFLDSDLCFSEGSTEWLPLPEFLRKTEAPRYSRTKARGGAGSSTPGTPSRRDRRAQRNAGPILAGWIAFLLALAAPAGAGFWIAGLYVEMNGQRVLVEEIQGKLAAKEKDYQRLLFVAREVAEPGLIRGSLILRNDSGKRVAMPGIPVSLYPRKAIEEHLAARSREASHLPAGTSVDAAEFYLRDLPRPIATTTTDASVRYEFSIPEPEEYIVFTTIVSSNQNGQFKRLWFVSFDSRDPLNTVVDITETNGVQQFIPSLMIVEGR
jgi:hypothetical protein